jgi:hypothetical protein
MMILYLSNEFMSLLIQVSALLLVIVFTIRSKNLKKALIFGICAMLSANVFGQMAVAGEGPGAFVGFAVLPFWGCCAVLLTHYIKCYTRKCSGRKSHES